MKWALIQNGKIREVFDFDPRDRFHPSLEFRQVPDDAKPEVDTVPALPAAARSIRDLVREVVLEVLRERSVGGTGTGTG
jgi:hypothetical protein